MTTTQQSWHPVRPNIADPELADQQLQYPVHSIQYPPQKKNFLQEHRFAIVVAVVVLVILLVVLYVYMTRKNTDKVKDKKPVDENKVDMGEVNRLREERRRVRNEKNTTNQKKSVSFVQPAEKIPDPVKPPEHDVENPPVQENTPDATQSVAQVLEEAQDGNTQVYIYTIKQESEPETAGDELTDLLESLEDEIQ